MLQAAIGSHFGSAIARGSSAPQPLQDLVVPTTTGKAVARDGQGRAEKGKNWTGRGIWLGRGWIWWQQHMLDPTLFCKPPWPFLSLDLHQLQSWSEETHCGLEGLWKGKEEMIPISPLKTSNMPPFSLLRVPFWHGCLDRGREQIGLVPKSCCGGESLHEYLPSKWATIMNWHIFTALSRHSKTGSVSSAMHWKALPCNDALISHATPPSRHHTLSAETNEGVSLPLARN